MKQITLACLFTCLAFVFLSACSKPSESSSTPSETPPQTPVQRTSPVELSAKWILGKRYLQRVETEQTIDSFGPGHPEPLRQTVSSSQTYFITPLTNSASAAGRQLEVEFLTLAIRIQMSRQEMIHFDSAADPEKDDGNPVVSSLRQAVGQRFTFTLNSSNRVEKIDGQKAFQRSLRQDTPSQARAILTGIFSEDSLKAMVEFNRGLPPQPVRPHDHWNVNFNFTLGPLGNVSLDSTNTFTGWEEHQDKRTAAISYRGILTADTNQTTNPLGVVTTIQSGRITGKSWFDPNLALIVDSTTDQQMTLLLTFQSPKNASTAAGSPSLTNQLSQTILLKTIEVSDLP